MSQHPFKFLSADDVKRALPMKDAIAKMKEAFALLSSNQAVVPPRIHLDISERNGTILMMPVYIQQCNRIGLKFLSLFGDNVEQGLPMIQAVVIVMDAGNGRPLALMDGASLTALRTGAGTGAATDILARHDSHVAVIFGAGVQGRTQLEAVCAVRSITQAYVVDIDRPRAEEFAREMSIRLSLPVDVAESHEVVEQADIICTVTTSAAPVFSDSNLKAGVHINAVGSFKPHIREIPAETVVRAKVIVDHRTSCLNEAGDLLIPMQAGLIDENHIYAEIGELINNAQSGRISDTEVTLYKSVGNAVQDLVAASEVLEMANALDLGVQVFL